MTIVKPNKLQTLPAKMPRCNGLLKKSRIEAGLSQNKLARLADLDRATVSKIENGSECLDVSVSKYLRALNSNYLAGQGEKLKYADVVVSDLAVSEAAS